MRTRTGLVQTGLYSVITRSSSTSTQVTIVQIYALTTRQYTVMQGTLFNYTHWSDTQLVQAHEPSNFHKINVKIWARNIMKYVGNNGSKVE